MKRRVAIGLNLLLIVCELIGLILTIKSVGRIPLEYYTELSNVISLVISCILIFYLFKGKVPELVRIVKFLSVVSLTVTFIVVLFVLGPMYDFDYKWLLFTNITFFYHLVCPIIAFISFVFFEDYKIEKEYCLWANGLTIGYAIVMVILNLCRVVDGPYPFLRLRHQNIFVSIIWIVVLIGGSYLLSIGIKRLKER